MGSMRRRVGRLIGEAMFVRFTRDTTFEVFGKLRKGLAGILNEPTRKAQEEFWDIP